MEKEERGDMDSTEASINEGAEEENNSSIIGE